MTTASMCVSLERERTIRFGRPPLGGHGLFHDSRRETVDDLHPLHKRVVLVTDFVTPRAKTASAEYPQPLQFGVDYIQQAVAIHRWRGVSVFGPVSPEIGDIGRRL